ncbi:MAG: acetyl-CoA carboxylase carboxyltransferase subunit alpha [Phycisphaerales bacterium]|nr:acetyl-CoA carboxylase carboxyltransferase subunit alpha [Phycisphaerales bacterium]
MSERPTTSSPVGPTNVLEFEKPIAQMEQEIQRLESLQAESGRDYSAMIGAIREQLQAALKHSYENLTPWEQVLVARHPRRPLARDYIRMLCKDFCELHGDKLYGDDRAIVTGFARLAGHRVMVVALHKGRDTREKIDVNFGCAHPEGYRKALQKMQLAAKFGVPIVCLVDTPGAYPGVEAEERGIARAIAVNLMEMSRLRTPIVAVVIGEGGSGGALGIAVADQVAVMEHAYYSVISPEGCAAILWKSGAQASIAAEALRLTSTHLKQLNLIDAIIPEPLGAAHRNPEEAARSLESWIGKTLRDLRRCKIEALLKRRYDRLRKLGSFFEDTSTGEPAAAEPARARGRRAARVSSPLGH